MRVLVCSQDPRFRRVARFLLARRGFDAVETRHLCPDLLGAGIDSILLDCEGAAGVPTPDGLDPEVDVILVGEAPLPDKWGPFDRIVERLEGTRKPVSFGDLSELRHPDLLSNALAPDQRSGS
jgi:hypothetical protein